MSTHVQRVRKLYKTIIKLHRGLPDDMKMLGNNYAKDEFKRHKNCTPEESAIFMNEWTSYVITLAEQLGLRGPQMSKSFGKSLTEAEIDKLRHEQIHQLYELMMAATVKDDSNS